MFPPEKIQQILKTLPNKPGVYQHLDANGKILYVGKAKDLKKRVSSYFNKTQDNAKTHVLVKKIADIRTIVTDNELEALLLENNLIKLHQPRYNVNLKDDKTYPWICIKNERFPRIFPTRRMIKDGSEYYGPFSSVKVMKAVLELVRQIYPIRTCNLALNKESIEAGKFKICLEYHLGNCKGPCEGLQTEEAYDADIAQARDLIRGNLNQVKKLLHEQMMQAAASLQFETAQRLKEKFELVDRYQAKSTVVNPAITNVDVYSVLVDAQYAYVNFMKIIDGAVIQSHTVELKRKLEETEEEILTLVLPELRQRFNSLSREVIVSHEVDLELPDVNIRVPQRGDKRSLIELSLKNARYFRLEKLKSIQLVDPDRHVNRLMAQMKSDLRLSEEPRHIECFDNSNLQGTNPVAACVVFKNGKPSKADYRHFHIKTVEGPNDFASMEEVVYRRYKRLLEEGEPLPQLIVIDGGKGQLGAALNSLEKLNLRGQVAILGIAKRLEELFFPGDQYPLYLDKKSETLKVIQQLRNEAHRFGITFHRSRRDKNTLKSEIEGIPGIGKSSAEALLKKFRSVKAIREATEDALAEVVGAKRARAVVEYFTDGQG